MNDINAAVRATQISSNESDGEPPADPRALRDSVEYAVSNYLRQIDGQKVTDFYDMVLQEVEAPLLEVVMKHTRHNQTRASELLGLNRGTLRKKLKRYGLL